MLTYLLGRPITGCAGSSPPLFQSFADLGIVVSFPRVPRSARPKSAQGRHHDRAPLSLWTRGEFSIMRQVWHQHGGGYWHWFTLSWASWQKHRTRSQLGRSRRGDESSRFTSHSDTEEHLPATMRRKPLRTSLYSYTYFITNKALGKRDFVSTKLFVLGHFHPSGINTNR